MGCGVEVWGGGVQGWMDDEGNGGCVGGWEGEGGERKGGKKSFLCAFCVCGFVCAQRCIPKSASFKSPASLMRRFCGFRSLREEKTCIKELFGCVCVMCVCVCV